LALVTILNTRDINLTINLFRKSITDYVVAEHNIALTLNEEDPGYYDQDNRKYISIDLSVRRGILVHYVTFNYAADLSKMSGVPICGVQRSMGNLLTEPALTDAAMAAHGNKFLNYLWKNLYPNYNVTTY
jgi:lipoate-protein ligase B